MMTNLFTNAKTAEEMKKVGALHRGLGGSWTSALPHNEFKERMANLCGKTLTADEIMEELRISSQLWKILKDKGYFKKA